MKLREEERDALFRVSHASPLSHLTSIGKIGLDIGPQVSVTLQHCMSLRFDSAFLRERIQAFLLACGTLHCGSNKEPKSAGFKLSRGMQTRLSRCSIKDKQRHLS